MIKTFEPITPASGAETAAPTPKMLVSIGAFAVINSNCVGLTVWPPGVMTRIVPGFASSGTVTFNSESERIWKSAGVSLNSTCVVPANPAPLTTICWLREAPGELNVILGNTEGLTVYGNGAVTVPPGAVTTIGPVAANGDTRNDTCVSESILNSSASTPPMVALVAPVKPTPVTTTIVPGAPASGVALKANGTGDGLTTKFAEVVNSGTSSGSSVFRLTVTTSTGPVVAPFGTTAVTTESLMTVTNCD